MIDKEVSSEKLSDEAKKALKDILIEIRTESRQFRNHKISQWRRNEAFWNNIQRALYMDGIKGYVTVGELSAIPELSIDDAELYERIINIYRAHGESFIAALSASLPSAVYTPSDADEPKDIATAKAYRKATQLIQLKNHAPLRFIKVLYHLYNHGVAYVYANYHRDKKYGVVKQPKIDYKKVKRTEDTCPHCAAPMEKMESMGGSMYGESDYQMHQMAPEAHQMMNPEAHQMMDQEMGPQMGPEMRGMNPEENQESQCLECGYQGPPNQEEYEEEVPYIHDFDETPKGQTNIEVYGPLHVTISHQVAKQEDSPYLILDSDIDKAWVKETYSDFEIGQDNANQDRSDRTPPNHPHTDQQNQLTVSRVWLRKWMFNRCNDEETVAELKSKFPNGAYIVFINETYAESCDENMDDCWETSVSPVSERVHAEPYGNTIIPIQEMVNDLIALTMETVETGIPVNFFDPTKINKDIFEKRAATPGDWVPAKPTPGQSLDSSIASTPTAQLSRGIEQLQAYLEKQSQFALGTFPSVFGGAAQGSKTLGEYKESRAQALQRLSIPWISAATLWVNAMKKASTIFFNNMLEDEKYVQDLGNQNFINIWIRQVELDGNIGDVTVESSEQIPMTWNQIRTTAMDLMAQKIPQIDSVIYHPENIDQMGSILGMTGFYIPGSRDRDKQLREISELVKSQAIPSPPGPDGQPQMAPSVEIDPEIDNHLVHVEVLKSFMVSEEGQQIKINNPGAWQNLLAHLSAHNMYLQMMQPQPEAEPAENQEQPNE